MVSNEDYLGFKAAGTFVIVGSPVAAFTYNFLAKFLTTPYDTPATASDTPITEAINYAGFMTFGSDHGYDTYFLWFIPILLACFVYVQSRRVIRSRISRLCAAACIGASILFLLRTLYLVMFQSTMWRYNAPDVVCATAAGVASAFLCAVIVEEFFSNSPEPDEAS
jgi:hypothetical protein